MGTPRSTVPAYTGRGRGPAGYPIQRIHRPGSGARRDRETRGHAHPNSPVRGGCPVRRRPPTPG
ncbi:hypothetical protein MMMB2_4596 [Mycobacterium marinum MB2]|nr:hypothetical protein MMMB2_4596 [Mycobacterium marinum MB2]